MIRLATAQDGPTLARIYAPYVQDTTISFEFESPSGDEMTARVLRLEDRLPWLVSEEQGQLLGYACATPHRERAAYQWSVDVSVYVSQGHQRAGVGRALYAELFSILRRQGYYRAYAGITLPNPASEGLHRKLGFEPVGVYHRVGYKFGCWHDVAWFELELQPPADSPAAPRRLSEL